MFGKRQGIAVAGNLIVDFYKEIDCYPDHSTLTSIRHINAETGGLACNVALALSKINRTLPIKVFGRVGNDEQGDYIVKQLENAENIDVASIIRDGQTSFTDVMIDRQNKTRTFFQYRGANDAFCQGDLSFDTLDAAILHIGYILLLDSLDAADEVFGTKMARLLADAQRHGIRTSIDVVSEVSERFSQIVPPALKYTDYAVVNEFEGEMITGIPIRNQEGMLLVDRAVQICRKFFELGVSTWAVIHAREGAIGLSCTDELIVMPSLCLDDKAISNPTGAGDAFASGVIYGAHQERSLAESMRLGIAAAAMSLLEFSASGGIGNEQELIRFFSETPKESWLCFAKIHDVLDC